jgi:hypothetical protein
MSFPVEAALRRLATVPAEDAASARLERFPNRAEKF